MAKGYQYRELNYFMELNIGQEYKTSTQLSLNLPNLDGDDTIHSTIRYLGESEHPDFLKYHVQHESLRPYKVRFNNVNRESVIVIEEFELFIPRNNSYLWADTKFRICNELLKRITNTENEIGNEFVYHERKINLIKMGKEFQSDITGGYFNQLAISDVQAASIFGPGVGESEDWQRYEHSGEISAIVIQLLFQGNIHRVMVTKNGGVVLYSHIPENDAIELIEIVNDMYGKYNISIED